MPEPRTAVRTGGDEPEHLLAERYGHRPGRDRVLAIIAASAIALTFLLWVIWAGVLGQHVFEARDLGYTVIDERSVSVTFDVATDPGTAISCALQAQNEKHGIVGWKIVELPPQDKRMVRYTETLRTTERAVNGLIYRCWVP